MTVTIPATDPTTVAIATTAVQNPWFITSEGFESVTRDNMKPGNSTARIASTQMKAETTKESAETIVPITL